MISEIPRLAGAAGEEVSDRDMELPGSFIGEALRPLVMDATEDRPEMICCGILPGTRELRDAIRGWEVGSVGEGLEVIGLEGAVEEGKRFIMRLVGYHKDTQPSV